MKRLSWIRVLFTIAAIYDGVLGVAFLVAPKAIFASLGVEAPYHSAFIQFPAMLLIVFALMFFRIAKQPVQNRELILYGCGLKVSYCLTVFWYEITSEISFIWIPWAWADLVFLILFLLAWKTLGKSAEAG